MDQPGSEVGAFQVGDGRGSESLLAKKYSSSSVLFSSSLTSVGK